jgi:predicted secreted hydrolase
MIVKRMESYVKNIQYTASAGVPHRSMEDEFLCHKKGSEWWYCTGVLNDESGKLYSFQFTLARIRLYGMQMHILMTAVTDFETKKHYYAQHPIFFGKDVMLTAEKVSLNGLAEMTFSAKELRLSIEEKEFTLTLNLDVTKPPVWHCDDGVLRMGVDDPKEKTYYWSYTNLAASGRLILENKESKVTGKAWFDKQGGTYTLTSRWTNWEWFSLRFFDGEEVMLFSFPQDNYQDGTYIEKSGSYRRLNDYVITTLGFTEAGGKKFSFGWKLEMKNIKQEQYTIIPKIDGQLNLFYFELVADIKDMDGKEVGYCVVELLPGVHNEKINVGAVLARSK